MNYIETALTPAVLDTLLQMSAHWAAENSMIELENKQLHSQRLTLRLVEPEDAPPLREMLRDPEVTKPAGFLPIETEEEFETFFSGLTAYHTGIAILAGDTVIGYCRVNKEQLDGPEFADKKLVGLGFVIGKPYQNQGYGTEMLKTVTAYLKERFDYCVADHFVENDPSRRVIEKAGYRYLEDYSMVFHHLGDEEKHLKSYIF